MIIGGDSSGGKENSTELFNWETGEHCKFVDLPYGVAGHIGTVINGVPVFCGGHLGSDPSRFCRKYIIQSKEWVQVKKCSTVIVFRLRNIL